MIQGHVLNDMNSELPIRITRTTNMLERMKGLLFRCALKHGEALWIQPCNSIHTFFMRYPIDVVFLDRSGKVLKVRENMPAWRICGSAGAVAVIELLAGTANTLGFQVGHQYQWVQYDL